MNKNYSYGEIKIKILFLSSFSELGGAEISLISLATGLKILKHDVTVLLSNKGMLTDILESVGVKYKLCPSKHFQRNKLFYIFAFPYQLLKTAKIIKQINPDIIHSNNQFASQWGLPIAYHLRIPIIIHHREIYLSPFSKILYFLYGKTASHIFISNFVRKMVLSKINKPVKESRIIQNMIYDPVQIDNHDFIKESLSSHPSCKFVVLLIGRIDPQKGHHRLIKAAHLINDPTICYVIAGSYIVSQNGKKYNDYCKHLITKYKLEKNFIFMDFSINITKYFSLCDLVVVPSKNEGFGRVVIEAMAYGKPVIADNSGGIKEIIKNNYDGLTLNTSNTKSFAKKILLLKNNPVLYKKIKKNGLLKMQKFSLKNHLNQIIEFYADVLQKTKHR